MSLTGRKGKFVGHANPIGRQPVSSRQRWRRNARRMRVLTCIRRDATFIRCSGSWRENYNNNAVSKAVFVCVHSGT